MLDALGISHPQLIDLGLLVGTDFHLHFLCDEHAFGRDRVMAALERAFGSQKLF